MAGENTFTSDTLESQKMKDPYEYARQQKDLQDAVGSVARYQTGGPVVGLNRFQQQAGQSEYLAGEQARREAASKGAMEIGSTIDARLTGAANTLSDAYSKYRNTADDLAQRQAQAVKGTGLDTEIGLEGVKNSRRELDFTLEKNQTLRDDALENAYVKGIVDDKMLEISGSGAMKLQDIDQYFKLKTNEIDQSFEDWKNQTNIDVTRMRAEMVASAQAFATLFQGIMEMTAELGRRAYG